MIRTARSLAALAAALLVAACGPSGPTEGPDGSQGAAGTPLPGTQAPFTLPPLPSGLVIPSFVLPSFNEDEELEALLPDQLGGTPISYLSMTGETFMANPLSSAQFEAVLEQFDKTPADLSVAFGGTPDITLFAYRIKGIAAGTFLPALVQAFGAQMGGVATSAETHGGKNVTKVDPSDGDIVYGYTSGDVVFIVGGDGLDTALLAEAFAALP